MSKQPYCAFAPKRLPFDNETKTSWRIQSLESSLLHENLGKTSDHNGAAGKPAGVVTEPGPGKV